MIDMKLLLSKMESIEKVTTELNQSIWYLSIDKADNYWLIFAGDSLLLHTDNEELVKVFIYALGLGMKSISSIGNERLNEDFRKYEAMKTKD